jgi:hypothetical protein
MSEFGNIDSRFFLYGAYAVSALALFLYTGIAVWLRNSDLTNLQNEGFLEEKK